MPTPFNVNAADLAYILKQIKIAEATSAAHTATPISILQAIMNAYGASAANAAQLPYGLRTVSGEFNSLLPGHDQAGAADNLFPRLTDPNFITVDGPGIDFNGDGIMDVVNHNYGDASAAAGTQLRSVADNDPRTVSNLIVDMSVANPAAIATFLNNPLSVEAFEAEMGFSPDTAWFTDPLNVDAGNTWLQTIPNQSPDIGLSPGFNSWMTFFGQFFDHGLDLVTKGNNGTVYIPLLADDPLYDKGKDGIANNIVQATDSGGNPLYYVSNPALNPVGAPPPATSTTVTAWAAMFNDDGFGADGLVGTADDRPNFMALTRATATIDANGVPQHENTTTSWIDQNQTYTSHESHQVFLREYVREGGTTFSTGKLLSGSAAGNSVDGAIGNWGEVKAQAETMLGLKLNDFDVHNVPLLKADQYGKFIAGANGYAQVAVKVEIVNSTTGTVVSAVGTAFVEGTDGGLDIHALGTGNLPAGFVLPALGSGQAYKVSTIGTGHAFLNDIAHHAAPGMYDANGDGFKESQQVADSDPGVGDDGDASTYDDEMLNAHFVTGDGRGNENIALTTVHSIFHSEHDRMVDLNKHTVLATGDLDFINEWLRVDIASLDEIATPEQRDALIANVTAWDGERLFQASRFSTEMQYQHLVFEEFARRIQPAVNPFVFNNSPEISGDIVAEFAHTVYRFGHSMLTGTVDRLDNGLATLQNQDGSFDQETLLAVFLNPQAYLGSGTDLHEINANIIRGLSRDVGNEIDEMIVTNVRSQLLGLPLDLGALNLARGRDTGIPSLNDTRAQLYNDTGFADLKPYSSWVDFADHIKNPLSVVNFIAAYGTHASITSATTMAEKREAAAELVFGVDGSDAESTVAADRLDFINATGAYAGGSLGGLNNVDLWIGGLAEALNEFGGMLGSTFNYVFEAQMENLQNGDRMYYLTRTQGTNLLMNLEPNTFSDLVMRNTDLGDQYSTHLNGALFVTPDLILELDKKIAQEEYGPKEYNGTDPGSDPDWGVGEPHSVFATKVTRDYTTAVGGVTPTVGVDGHNIGGTIRFYGGEHVVLGGTEGNDALYGDKGIDTLWGDGGNDYLNAGMESDDVFGGEGDDIIEDPFGDDVLRGNQGNDVVSSARGADILFGDEGNDFIKVGQDASEVFGGEGDDFILGGDGGDAVLGNEGDDWIEGGRGFDGIDADNSELFFNSPIIGHDVMFGQADETDYEGESGDDIMGSGASVFRYGGQAGFDWAIGKGENTGVYFDMNIGLVATVPNDILRDRFDLIEGASGAQYNDTIIGDNRGSALTALDPLLNFADHILTQEGIDRITGLNTWFAGARETLGPSIQGDGTNFRDGNLLMGGDGNDVLAGHGGYDILDGDSYLNVRIKIDVGGTIYSAESLNTDTTAMGQYAGKVFNTNPDGSPNFASVAFGGRSLQSLLLDRTINPGQMSIVREILNDATNITGPGMNIDTVVFQGTRGEYDIEGVTETTQAGDTSLSYVGTPQDLDGDGFIYVLDRDIGTGATVFQLVDGVATQVTLGKRVDATGKIAIDDIDLIRNFEKIQFADQSISLIRPTLDLNSLVVTTTTANISDNFNTPNPAWTETNDGANTLSTGQIQIDGSTQIVLTTDQMRFLNGDGADVRRTFDLSGVTSATMTFQARQDGLDAGETVSVQFAADGVNFTQVALIDSSWSAFTFAPMTVNLTGAFSANSAVRFVTSSIVGLFEEVRIDNFNIAAVTTTSTPGSAGNDFAATFTENGAAVAIALGAGITSTASTIQSATIVLRDWQAGDVLSATGLPAGITASATSLVGTELTLTLTGSASLAAYQTALGQVRYQNTSDAPGDSQRLIQATVTDSFGTSAQASATITVVSVDDAPIASANQIVTNVALGTTLVIPEWAFLANDVDVDSVLDITAVSASNGLDGLSLATNPGSVTLSDLSPANGSFTYTATGDGVNANANVSVTTVNAIENGNVRDQFSSPSYANNNGSASWVANWAETGDDNSVTSAAGQIRITGGTMVFDAGNNLAASDGASIQRTVDLAGATSATLSYNYAQLGLDAGESLTVEFSDDGSFSAGHVQLIQTISSTTAPGPLASTVRTAALTGNFTANAAVRFTTSAMSLDADSVVIDNVNIAYTRPAVISGGNGSDVLVGNGDATRFNAGAGKDSIFAGGGNDVINAGNDDDMIVQNSTDGRDLVDGGAGRDTYQLDGDGSAEAFTIYTRSAWLGIAGNTAAQLAANTEIVVTRNGSDNLAVVAELDNIEEIVVNTLNTTVNDGNGLVNSGGSAGDTINVVGDFTTTSLDYSTITINGSGALDTVDITGLSSDHRIVFNGGGGSDSVMGTLRPQDVVNATLVHSGVAGQSIAASESMLSPIGNLGEVNGANWFDEAWSMGDFGFADVVGNLGSFLSSSPAITGVSKLYDADMLGSRLNGFMESYAMGTGSNFQHFGQDYTTLAAYDEADGVVTGFEQASELWAGNDWYTNWHQDTGAFL